MAEWFVRYLDVQTNRETESRRMDTRDEAIALCSARETSGAPGPGAGIARDNELVQAGRDELVLARLPPIADLEHSRLIHGASCDVDHSQFAGAAPSPAQQSTRDDLPRFAGLFLL
jgi:hypothetical protein